MVIALVCTAVLGVLIFGLGLAISIYRFMTKAYYVGADRPAAFTTKLSRAHGNTAECQSASKRDPLSACNRDPLLRFGMDVTSAPLARVGA